jgi:hypothetical protein
MALFAACARGKQALVPLRPIRAAQERTIERKVAHVG